MKKAFLTILIFALTALPTQAATFSDVSASETYRTGIEFLTDEGIVNGYPDGTYKPQQTVNRAEILKIIAEAYVKQQNTDSSIFDKYKSQKCFNDSQVGQWYNKYVCFGKDNGWIVGYENGQVFRPEQTVTFVEALKITYKGLNKDFTEGSVWYQDLVERASSKNFIPFDITTFNAQFRRNQMADMITRILKEQRGDLSQYLGSRADVVVTYDSIEKGQDLTKLELEIVCPENRSC